MNKIDVISPIMSKLSGYESQAEQIGRSRLMIYCMDIGANPEEQKEIERIANSFKYEVSNSGDEIELRRMYLQSPFEDIIENGMPAPYTGGEGGLVHLPDGSTRPSNVPEQLWGYELPWYAKQRSSAFSEMDTMQRSLFSQAVKDAVHASRSEYAEQVRKNMTKMISGLNEVV